MVKPQRLKKTQLITAEGASSQFRFPVVPGTTPNYGGNRSRGIAGFKRDDEGICPLSYTIPRERVPKEHVLWRQSRAFH